MEAANTSRTIYRSKPITGLLIAITCILAIFILLFLFLKSWWMLAFMVLLTGFVVHMFMTTYYVVEQNKLTIRSGFMVNKKLDITSIRKVSETWDAISSPATTFDRLDIVYNQFENIMISPEDKTGFVAHLLKLNPEIEVKLKAQS